MSYATAHNLLTRLQADKAQATMRALCGCVMPHAAHPVPEAARELELLDWSVCPFWLLDHVPHRRIVATLRKLAAIGIQPRGELAAWAVIALTTGDA